MSSVFSQHLYIRRCHCEDYSHLFTLDARYADIGVDMQTLVSDISRINRGFRGSGIQGAGYDVGSRFASGRISTAPVTQVCFGLTADSTEAERAELIEINLNVAAVMHHIFCCIHNIGIDR